MLSPLESRRLFAVSVVNALPDRVVFPDAATVTVPLTGRFASDSINGTVVRFVTDLLGVINNVDIELYDRALTGRSAAPITTANFLSYVNAGTYTDTIFHRALNFNVPADPAQFLQGGGFSASVANNTASLLQVATNAPIALEFASDRPNTRGTIAMARTTDPNSATSGFFFNVKDNSGIFNASNPYAVFGRVLGPGLTMLDAYSFLPRRQVTFNFPQFGQSFPLSDVPVVNPNLSPLARADNLVYVRSASVLQSPETVLTYTVTSSNTSVVAASVNAQNELVIDYGTNAGTANVTVTARDLDGKTNTSTFSVTTLARPNLSLGGSPLADGATVNYGLLVNGAAASRTLTVTNLNAVPITLGTLSLPTRFSSAALPGTLAANASLNFTVDLSTSVDGNVAGTLSLPTSAGDLSLGLAASVYTPVAPTLSFNGAVLSGGTTLDLGLIPRNETNSNSRTFTLSNPNPVAITLGDVSLPPGIDGASILPESIDPLGTAVFTVAVDTTTSGVRSGTLSFSSSTGSVSVPLSATVFAPELAVSLGGADITPGQAINAPLALKGVQTRLTFALRNPGFGPVRIESPVVPNGFIVVTAPPTILAAGATGSFVIEIVTAGTGTRSGNLSLATDASDSGTFDYPLSATVALPLTLGGTGNPRSFTYTDADGTLATLSLAGPGTASVLLTGDDITTTPRGTRTTVNGAGSLLTVALSGTTTATSLSATATRGDRRVTVRSLSSATPLRSLRLAPVNVISSLSLTGGVASLALGDLTDTTGTLAPASPNATLAFATLTRADLTLTAPARSLTAAALDRSNIVGSDLRTLSVRGGVVDSVFDFSRDLGTVSIASLADDSIVKAGRSLVSLTLTSRSNDAFAGSVISAPTITSLSLGRVTGTGEASIVSSDNLARLTLRDPQNRTFSARAVTAANDPAAALVLRGITASRLAFVPTAS